MKMLLREENPTLHTQQMTTIEVPDNLAGLYPRSIARQMGIKPVHSDSILYLMTHQQYRDWTIGKFNMDLAKIT